MGNVEGVSEAEGMVIGKGEREKYNKLRPRAQKQRDNNGIGGLCDTPKAKRKAILMLFSISRSPCGITMMRRRPPHFFLSSFFSNSTRCAYFHLKQ